MHDIIKMCSFETNKSTKGASKMRRDLLNSEITQLRDLIPLPPSTRQRLSQLQLMALVCVYIRKSNYFQQAMKNQSPEKRCIESPNTEFLKALSGFLMMLTQGGKLLYISDNAAEYLGHSMEDLLIHGDSVFDIIDKQDHASVQSELVRGAQGSVPAEDERLFLCRMNVSRNARRQMRFGDQKVVLVQGHYMSYLPLCSRNEPVFVAHCTPVAMPETRESVVQGATNVFTSVHTLDMKFNSIDRNGEFYLGYESSYLCGASWYHLIHPENLKEAQTKHRLITSSEQERSCIMLLRLQSSTGSWLWVHCVLQVKDSGESPSGTGPTSPSRPTPVGTEQGSMNTTHSTPGSPVSQQPVIVATNQVLSEREAKVLRANSWLYQYFAMQTKLQYGLAYEAHAQRIHAYYPQVMPYQADAASPYIAAPSLAGPHYPQPYPSHPSATSAYSFGATNPYLHHYSNPYSVRFHPNLDYSREVRDTSWSYYDAHTPSTSSEASSHSSGISSHSTQSANSSSSPQIVGHPVRSNKKIGLSATSPKKPHQDVSSNSSSSIATPVALRATVTAHHKNTSPPEGDENLNHWKSGLQECAEYSQYYPYIHPAYSSSTSTKLSVLAFESSHKEVQNSFQEQAVASAAHNAHHRDAPWYAHTFVR